MQTIDNILISCIIESMKNLELLPEVIRNEVQKGYWNCGCGQNNLRYSVTKKGKIQAHCFNCGMTIFWNDIYIFSPGGKVFSYLNENPVEKVAKNGARTYWYPKHRVRVFKV